MARLPAVFVSHGSPMHALDRGVIGETWSRLGRALPRPAAILIASAHWETATPALGGAERPRTIHDFGGFPPALHRLEYPARGSPDLARRARSLLEAAGIEAGIDDARGLDHGAWSPLLHLYPDADIPVVELSVQPQRDARAHLEVGSALAPLRDEGVLVIGSGHMTHNLREFFTGARDAGYVEEFRRWVQARLESGDLETLADYRRSAPHAARAHPTAEHFLPLFVAAGAARGYARAARVLDLIDGTLAMDTYVFE